MTQPTFRPVVAPRPTLPTIQLAMQPDGTVTLGAQAMPQSRPWAATVRMLLAALVQATEQALAEGAAAAASPLIHVSAAPRPAEVPIRFSIERRG